MAAPDFAAPSVFAERVASAHAARRLSRQTFIGVAAILEASADFAVSVLGFLFAHAVVSWLAPAGYSHASPHSLEGTASVLGLLIVVLTQREGGYCGASGLLRIRDTERALRISVQSLALLCAMGTLIGDRVSSFDFLIATLLVPAFLTFERHAAFLIAARMRRSVRGPSRVAIYAAGATGRTVASALFDSPRLGLQPVVLIDPGASEVPAMLPTMGYRNRSSIPVRPGPVTAGRLQSVQCDLLLIADNQLSAGERDGAVDAARLARCDVALCAAIPSPEHGKTALHLDGFLFTSPARPRPPRHYAAVKRITDIALSSVMLITVGPVLLAIAVLVRLDSPGPALFLQKRVGQNGRLFDIVKFRTMVADAAKYSVSPRSSNDPRITRVGRFLRRFNLDELPQLLNVLSGTMSLVGPRPEMPFIAATYDARSRQRLDAVPGMTGLWQLSADRSFPIHENLEYDLYYRRHRGFFLDLAILAHTVMFAMSGGI